MSESEPWEPGVRRQQRREALDAKAVLCRLELLITRRLDGLLHGQHQGLVPGAGSEPGESRLYVPGDDVRLIDWSVTARTTEPHVRVTDVEHELETWLLVDLSASMQYGTAIYSKRELTLAAAAAIGFLTERTGNRLGALLLRGEGNRVLPARSRRTHLLHVLDLVATLPIRDGTGPVDLAAGIDAVERLATRRGLVAVLSDFVTATRWQLPLRKLAARHEVLVVEIVDRRELQLPDVGVVDLVDPETGITLEAPTLDGALRRAYAEAAEGQRDAIRSAVLAAGADRLRLSTDQSWLTEIARFVALRREHRALRH